MLYYDAVSESVERLNSSAAAGRQAFYHIPEKVRASSDRVVVKVFCCLFTAVVLAGIGPDEVAHWPERWRLFKPV